MPRSCLGGPTFVTECEWEGKCLAGHPYHIVDVRETVTAMQRAALVWLGAPPEKPTSEVNTTG